MPRRLEIEDIERLQMPSSPRLSNTSDELAFMVTRVQENSYIPTIYIVDTKSGKIKRSFDGATDPSWSTDGKLLFLSDRECKEGTGIWVTTGAGEPRLVTVVRDGVEHPSWNHDGSKILFLSYVGEEPKDRQVIDDVPYNIDGIGWTYYRRKELHSVDLSSGEIIQLTHEDGDVVSFTPSNKGSTVGYAVSKTGPIPMGRQELRVIDTESGERSSVLPGYAISRLGWSPDDDLIYFFGNDFSHNIASHSDVWTVKPSGGEPRSLTGELDRDVTGGILSDLTSPFTGSPDHPWYDDRIYFLVSDRGRTNIHSVEVETGAIAPVVEGDFSVCEFSMSNGVIAYVKTSIDELPEIWLREGSMDRKLTNLAETLDARLLPGEHFTFDASDGETLDGWLIKPSGWRRGRRYPAILEIHGGPKAMYGYVPMLDFQIWAAAGYAVVYMNPRGSDGYPQAFADLKGRYGTRDYHDLVEAVNHVVDTHDWIDGERLGVTGVSYGGYMTNWIVGHTDLFRCAVSQNGISNYLDMFGVGDVGYLFTPYILDGDPWENPEMWRERSPITHVKDVTTPTLFIHSAFDIRCPLGQAQQMFAALRYLDKPAKLIIYNEGTHLFKFYGPPSVRKRRIHDMLDWFNHHLK